MNKTAQTKSLKRLIELDSRRYGNKGILRNLLNPGFRYMFFFRICACLKQRRSLLYFLPYLLLRHYKYKYGIEIHPQTKVGAGFYIGHFGGIVVNTNAVIGCNVNISQGVTVGSVNRGRKCGFPTIGNNVYIGPGAKILGNIHVGDNSAIGANAVVLDDVPDNCCVGGIPAKIISNNGAGPEYIQNPIEIE